MKISEIFTHTKTPKSADPQTVNPKNKGFYLEMLGWRPVSERVSFIGTDSIFKPFFRDFVFYLIWLTAQ